MPIERKRTLKPGDSKKVRRAKLRPAKKLRKAKSEPRRKQTKRTGPRDPYFLDEKMIEDFVASIAETPGGPIEFHCESLGIGRATYYEWRERAAREPGGICARFVERVDKALGEGFKILYAKAITARPHEVLFRRRYELFPNDHRIAMELSGSLDVSVAPVTIELHCDGAVQPFSYRDEAAELPPQPPAQSAIRPPEPAAPPSQAVDLLEKNVALNGVPSRLAQVLRQ
jgi:hypothetical protein